MMTLPQWVKLILGDEGTSITDNNIHRWQEWLEPVSDDHPCGEDVAYTDDFEAIKIELAKLSGMDYRLILDASERLLKRESKDLRVATYYIFASLRDRGLAGVFGRLGDFVRVAAKIRSVAVAEKACTKT